MPRPGGPPIFKDVSKLSFDYVPKRMPHREKQLEALHNLFHPLIEANLSQNAFLVGNVGTGKTHVSKKFCMDFQRLAQERDKNVEYVLVNCRQRMTEDAVLLSILKRWDDRFPDRGFSIPEKLSVLRKQLEKRRAHLVVVLDEADVLVKKSSDLIYNFTRFDEEYQGPRGSISLILISQRHILNSLDKATLSTFGRSNVVEFGKYSREELRDILGDRLDLAFFPDVVREECVDLIADIASGYGDARYAIELLWKAGELALEEDMREVLPEHVRGARATTHALVSEEALKSLDRAKMVALLSIARKLEKRAYVTTGEAEEAYAVVCEEYGERKRGHTQFWKYLQDLDALGFIEAKPSGEGVTGKTTIISMQEVPARSLIERLDARLSK
ncbi:MAG: Cdc6/Cdc18 family protein [Thermoplasmata archaeon]